MALNKLPLIPDAKWPNPFYCLNPMVLPAMTCTCATRTQIQLIQKNRVSCPDFVNHTQGARRHQITQNMKQWKSQQTTWKDLKLHSGMF